MILRGWFSPEVIQKAREEMELLVEAHARRLLEEGRISDSLSHEPFETRLFRLYESCMEIAPKSFRRELHLRGLYEWFFHPRLLDVVESILGREIRLYPNYTARPKFPDWEGTLVLWHQDGGYTNTLETAAYGGVTLLRMVNVWSPLVPARVGNGCMQFVPGTHKLGVVPHAQKTHYLEIEKDYLEPRLSEAVDIEVDPGDVVLFHNLLFHCGLPNRVDTIRWSLDWRYQDATQSTLRKEAGHLARSRHQPEQVVRSAEEWASLSFR